MPKLSKSVSVRALLCGVAACTLATIGSASADDKLFSGSIGVNANSHFVSYGADVWGAGSDIYGSQSTFSAWSDFNLAFAPGWNFNFGTWSDINDNTTSGLGGNIQEIDWYTGVSYNFGPATLGLTYQEWNYASDEEKVLDVALTFDDTGWIIPDYSFSPKIVLHNRLDGNGSQKTGSAVVFSIAPGIPLGDMPFSLTIPAGIAYFMDGDFQIASSTKGGGYGFSYVGASFGYPLSFIPPAYGAWSSNLDLIEYFTDSSMIANPTENFLTAQVGLKLSF